MIYLVPDPLLCSWDVAPSSREEIVAAGDTMDRLHDVLALAGRLTHSDLLPNNRFRLVLTERTNTLFWDNAATTAAHAVLGPKARALMQRMIDVTSHTLYADQERFVTEENFEAALEPALEDPDGELAYMLACIVRALDACQDGPNATRCVLLVPPPDSEIPQGEVTLSLPDLDDPVTFRIGSDPSGLGEFNDGTLILRTEDHPDWRQRAATKTEHERSLNDMVDATGGSIQPGKGHTSYTIAVKKYVAWRGLVRDQRRLKQLTCDPEFTVRFTVDDDRTRFEQSYARQKGLKLGLTNKRAWWLFFQEREGVCSPKLSDLLTGLT